MAKSSITLLANTPTGGTFLCPVRKSREYPCWFASLTAQGTFGSGTLAFFVSFDKGTTLIALKDLTDSAVSLTSAGSINVQLGTSRDISDEPQIWVELTGSTSPNIVVSALDNN